MEVTTISSSLDRPAPMESLSETPELAAEIAEASRRLEAAHPREVIRWAYDRFGRQLTMATAFGPEGCVILRYVAEVAPDLYVFNVDTGYQFRETLELRDRIAQKYG
ncbi:MAG: phosphoadenosine phosphosulfate reductase family protein, partial [Planctomycetales bacterium]|nr:phosphoadenosine phosphosulfate reductase family protein [Planctomycetales bacterium]